jgi:hypothetical protein
MVQFRRSKKFGPFRITMSQRGLSASVGAGPVRITKGADGNVRRTIRVPGTGLYDTRVVSRSPRKPVSGKVQQTPMGPMPYPPPHLPPAGWYADPTDEASRRYWDGRQWTSATDGDALPAALTQHQCPAVVGERLAVAVGGLRGWRLLVANMRDDTDTSNRILNEVEGCALCLHLMIVFLAAMAASNMTATNKDLAITVAEKQLAQFVDAAKREL